MIKSLKRVYLYIYNIIYYIHRKPYTNFVSDGNIWSLPKRTKFYTGWLHAHSLAQSWFFFYHHIKYYIVELWLWKLLSYHKQVYRIVLYILMDTELIFKNHLIIIKRLDILYICTFLYLSDLMPASWLLLCLPV